MKGLVFDNIESVIELESRIELAASGKLPVGTTSVSKKCQSCDHEGKPLDGFALSFLTEDSIYDLYSNVLTQEEKDSICALIGNYIEI